MTVTSTVPVPAGDVAVMEVALTTVTLVAAVVPKSTAVAPVKPVPVMRHRSPAGGRARSGADAGDGGGGRVGEVVGAELAALVPPGVVTVTSTVPVPAGDVAVILVELTTVKVVAASVPKCTAVAPVKAVPVMVTEVPPAVGPEVGLTPVTVGAAA